jgi:hypothetical protein
MIKKDYILTTHAKQRMKERGVSEKEVFEVLKDPEYSYPGPAGEKNYIKTIGERKIRVVFDSKKNQKIIITAIIM